MIDQMKTDLDKELVVFNSKPKQKPYPKPIKISRVDSVPEIRQAKCNYRGQLAEFLKSNNVIGIIKHPLGNNMAAYSSISSLTRLDPFFRGKIKSCSRGGRVFVMKIREG